MSRLLAPLSKAPPRSDEVARRGAPLEIPGEARFETKVVLTWGSVWVLSVGECALVLRWPVPWWHPRYGATVCRESFTNSLIVDVSGPFPPGEEDDLLVRPRVESKIHKKK